MQTQSDQNREFAFRAATEQAQVEQDDSPSRNKMCVKFPWYKRMYTLLSGSPVYDASALANSVSRHVHFIFLSLLFTLFIMSTFIVSHMTDAFSLSHMTHYESLLRSMTPNS